MIDFRPPIRRATPADAFALADLVNMAGEGMPLYLWRQMARDGEDPWAVGRARQAEKLQGTQVYVIDTGDGPIASLTGYPTPAVPVPIADDAVAMFVPLLELENLAPSTWYVNVLAAYPEHRGRGYGTQLLRLAEEIASNQGFAAVSIIVASANTGARRLYERNNYVEVARRLVVKDGWECESDEWVLLVKQI